MDHNRRAAKGRHGNWRLCSLLETEAFSPSFFTENCPSSLLPLYYFGFSFQLHISLSLSLSSSLPPSLLNSPATLHFLCTHLGLTAIRGDAAIKDEPGAVKQPLLAPLRAMELDWSPDTSMSDGRGRETKRTKKTSLDYECNAYYTSILHQRCGDSHHSSSLS